MLEKQKTKTNNKKLAGLGLLAIGAKGLRRLNVCPLYHTSLVTN